MSEYIYGTDDDEGHWLTSEEIVRCRDCGYYEEKTYKWMNGWTRTSTTCGLFDDCRVEPDGFCKWGERCGK